MPSPTIPEFRKYLEEKSGANPFLLFSASLGFLGILGDRLLLKWT